MKHLLGKKAGGLAFALLVFVAVFGILSSRFNPAPEETLRLHGHDFTGATTFDDGFSNDLRLFGRDNSTLDPYHCTKDVPCHTVACCGSFQGTDTGVCGFGPTFCGSDCTSQCDAKPECGQYADPAGKTCPLNVCCSKYGFCGSTSLFCDADQECQSNCGHPGPPPGANPDLTSRVIGYYESWSARRTCHPMPPSGIPIDGLTHVNFAFAYIDPNSFDITPMDSLTPASLFAQTADVRALKSGNSDLEVFISIGGWTFSDNGTATQPVLSNIASSAPNRQKFADNLVSFMQNYGFDGVDIDWEYPGAPDRGGHDEDTDNFVLLAQTLRETFDRSDRGSYGLSFTIPSSYWYLRWFDVPGMLKYADWANFMTYDLHGVWDKEDPIGSIVLAHTNLTEIKTSVELLWRVGVPPEKIVLGLGFYGRSFELSDPSCSAPGCPFAGAAAPGSCTNSAGTLAYFEIQDIIAQEQPNIIHDEAAAVNYITFNDNQWVSYDDDVTFKQKTDWASSVGLGGLMVWSIDQDDNDFSALTGLLGKNPGAFGSLKESQQIDDAGHWASQNGQQCIQTDCADVPRCPTGFELAPFPEPKAFPDTCKKDQSRVICCPVDAMPQSCIWRGGETTRACHGQCHPGESTLFHSRHATVNCLSPGFQSACCQASTYGDLISQCYLDSKGYSRSYKKGTCTQPGFAPIEQAVRDTGEYSNYWYAVCCPEPTPFSGCHWVGKGSCDDNECAATDVEAFLDPLGDSGYCGGGVLGRQKALCCYPPKNANPFLPVDLDKIFPTLPPVTDIPFFDEQLLGADGGPSIDEPNQQTFGLVVIDGPAGTVTSVNRRDADAVDLEVLSCSEILEHGISTMRMVCPRPDLGNCEIGLGDVEGTIIRLPDNCGPGSYVVAHAMRPSTDQNLVNGTASRLPPNAVVFDVDVSFDFSLAKRDSGDIFVRIDYSNSFNYWNTVVKGDPVTKRSLGRRFYSPDSGAWKTAFGALRGTTRAGEGRLNSDKFHKVIISDGQKDKHCSNEDDGYLFVSLDGIVEDYINFGYSFVGTIAPTFHIEEANGFFDGTMAYQGAMNFDGKGSLNIEGGVRSLPLFGSPISNWAFSHPGICSFSPQMNINVRPSGSEHDIDAKFTAKIYAGTTQNTMVSQPKALGDASGQPANSQLSSAFEGAISLSDGRSKKKSKRQAGDEGTVFAMTMVLEALMNIQLNQYESSELNVNSTWTHYTNSYFRIKDNGDVTFSNDQTGYEIDAPGGLPGWEAVARTGLGPHGNAFVLHTGTGTPDRGGAPPSDPADLPLFNGHYMTCGTGGQPESGGSDTCACTATSNLTQYDPSLASDDDDGDSSAKLLKRGTGQGRGYTVIVPADPDDSDDEGDSFEIESHTYINGENGEALLRANPNAGFYNGMSNAGCNDNSVDANSGDRDVRYATEHVMELQYLKNLLEFLLAGQETLSDGSVYTQPNFDPVPSEYIYAGRNDASASQNYLQRPYKDWDPNGQRTSQYGDDSPLDRLWRAFGDKTNPGHNLNTEDVLNSIKGRIWKGSNPVADRAWTKNHFDQPRNCDDIAAALSAINVPFQVFNYLALPDVRGAMAYCLSTIQDELRYFAQRVNAVANANLPDLGNVHLRYFYGVVVPRMENIDAWVDRRLGPLTQAAIARAESDPNDQNLQNLLDQLQDPDARDTSSLVLDTEGYPEYPSDSDPDRKRKV